MTMLTTHTGSLPRPAALRAGPPGEGVPDELLSDVVATVVKQQRETGLDIVNDGEMSKPSYVGYITSRLSGFGGPPRAPQRRNVDDFPEYAKSFGGPGVAKALAQPSCNGPVAYVGQRDRDRDLANLAAAARAADAPDVFMTAASPGVIGLFMADEHYLDEKRYLYAIADAMKEEYDAIHRAGFCVQLDCPDIAAGWDQEDPDATVERFRERVALRIEVIDYATRDIPPERLRMHMCWGNYPGPHHRDIPLRELVDLVLPARPSMLLLESANPRHEHEWAVFRDTSLPDGKIIVPGLIDTTTAYIEHPELVAQRLRRFTELLGEDRVIAGVDCGFATFAALDLVHPELTWAKLAALVEGVGLAQT